MCDKNQKTQNEYDEYIQGNGFTIARKGRHIMMQSHRNKEQQKAFLQAIQDGLKETENTIKAQIQEIQDIIQNYDPFDIIANISFRNSIINPEEFKEYESQINPAFVEYIALLCLSIPFESFATKNKGPFPSNLIEDVQERIKDLFDSQTFYLAFKGTNPDQNKSPEVSERFRFFTLMDSLVVRYPSYHHHLIEDLYGIFSPLSEELKETLGFNIDDAILILDAIEDLLTNKLIKKRRESIQISKDIKQAVKYFRQKKKIQDKFSFIPKDIIEDLAKEKPSISSKRLNNASIGWTFHDLGKTFMFSIDEVAKLTKLYPECVKSFLEKFSLRFGDVDPFYRTPAPTHPLMRKPIIEHEGLFFCPVINSTYWVLRPAIEDFLNPDNKDTVIKNDRIWQKYLKIRANYLESSALSYLEKGLKNATSYQNLEYEVIVKDGKRINTELDGLLLLDTGIYLVEAKSGSLSAPARRGAPSMKEDLGKLVEEAYSQALRASNYIANNDEPTFQLSDGAEIVIDKMKYDEIFLITVSLDDLDAFVTNTYLLKEYGLLQGSNNFPWAVSLSNLRVICEINDLSSQLVHYIKRRLHINELGWVNAHDELDLFGHYLLEGLYFDNLEVESDKEFIYNLLSYSWIFDDYYAYTTGQRKTPVDKPSQNMPPMMKEILTELDNKQERGYIKVACCLLDMDSETRENFAKMAQESRQLAIDDHKIHSFTMPFVDGNFGFSFFTSPIELQEEFVRQIQGYSTLKKYQTKFQKWISIGCITDTATWIDSFLILESEWEYNQQLDDIANKYLQPWTEP